MFGLLALMVLPVVFIVLWSMRSGTGDETVHLATAENETEAAIWRDILSRAGINSMQRSTDPLGSGAYGAAAPAPFSIEVIVRAADVRRAREVLGLRRPRLRRS